MPKTSIMRYTLILFLALPLIAFAETPEIKEYQVVKGDTLWDIAKAELNDPFLWPGLWKENAGIADPNRIYPDQVIRIPRSLVPAEKRAENAARKSVSAFRESALAERQRDKEIKKETALKPAAASHSPAAAAGERYQGITGIILYDGTVIEGQIISMNAEIVKIRAKDGKVASYSFIRDVENFIKE
ncbi:MAG: LysM peptidoglycan-binding domain-containing protein [Deltaproteobacteria bacterium]